jgi:hypothetical protein
LARRCDFWSHERDDWLGDDWLIATARSLIEPEKEKETGRRELGRRFAGELESGMTSSRGHQSPPSHWPVLRSDC